MLRDAGWLVNEGCHFEDGDGVELISDGSNIPVTPENVGRHQQLMAERFLLGREPGKTWAFIRGFWERAEAEALPECAFTEREIQKLLRGRVKIDFKRWRTQTMHKWTLIREEMVKQVIEWFWDIVGRLGSGRQRLML